MVFTAKENCLTTHCKQVPPGMSLERGAPRIFHIPHKTSEGRTRNHILHFGHHYLIQSVGIWP